MSLRKGLLLFFTFTIGVGVIILFSSVDGRTYHLLLRANKKGILLALVCTVTAWCFDALRFCAVARAASEKINFKLGLAITWLNYFGCAVTPMQTGGGPFQIYVLYKHNIPIGKGVAITLVRTMLTMFLLGLVVPIAVMVEPGLLLGHHILAGFFLYVVVFVLFSWALIILSLLRPDIMKHWGQIVTLLLKKFGMVKPRSVLLTIRRINHEIDNYTMNFKLFFTSGRRSFAHALLFSVLHLFFLFSVLPMLIYSIGLDFNYLQTVLTQGVFMFILYFIPTPGASGVAEGGGAALFSLFLPWNIAGVMAITWRFFTEYLAIFMGAIVAAKMIGWDTSQEIFKKDSENYDRYQ